MVLNLKNYADIKKYCVKCKWTVRNKKIFFQDWGGAEITFSYPSTVYSISQRNLGKKY